MSISRGIIPLFGWLSEYRGEGVRCDVVVGLYSSLIPLVVYCRARHLASAQRHDDLHHRHPGGRHHCPACPGRRWRRPDGHRHHPVTAGRGVPAAGGDPAPRRRGQPDLRTGAHWLQGGDRLGHRPRPDPQAAGDSHHQGRVFPRHRCHRPPFAGAFRAHAGAGVGHAAADGRPGAFHTKSAGAAGDRCRRHRPGRFWGIGRQGAPTGRRGTGRVAGLRPARLCPCGKTLAQRPGDRPDELCRDCRHRTSLCAPRRSAAEGQSGAGGARRGQPGRQPVPDHAGRRRDFADRGQPRRGRAKPGCRS